MHPAEGGFKSLKYQKEVAARPPKSILIRMIRTIRVPIPLREAKPNKSFVHS
jgi:hypothetical protein